MSDIAPAEAIFFAALEKATPAERAAYLDEACAGRPELRERVELLLADHFKAGGIPKQTPGEAIGPLTAPALEVTGPYRSDPAAAGTLIAGKYKLLQQIGEGGMGTVWMADQLEPVRRRVAVKLIRSERDGSRTILSRFEAERQAIALMDHPHIAKLLDAGTTDGESSWRPFFVMELVKGIPLNAYCDEHKLSISDRLNLFMQICSAVQHAHQKGIIHRDLKPTNILVESHDDKPVPKVIDFGLAKAMSGQPLTEHTLFTGFGTVAGTPLYMAPEQAKFNAIDIDTRADIYALGVILYELLTGSTPIEREQLKRAAFEEMLRLVRESEPPTPSKRLSSTDSKPSIAANRRTEPTKLGRFLRGDLDWVVMKALAKERERRYETASGFARDIERFLNHEPVSAGPPSASYRLRKFVRRNRPQVVAGALLLLALVAGIAGTTVGLVREARQRSIAEANEAKALLASVEEGKARQREFERAEGERLAKEGEKAKRKEAETNLAYAQKGNEILGSVFAELDPKANYATVADLRDALKVNLNKAVRELEGSAIGDPLVVATMQHTLGQSLYGLGEISAAIAVFRKASETRKAHLDSDHPETLASMNNLAMAYQAAAKLDLALPLYQETLKLRKDKLGSDHPDTIATMNNLASLYYAAGKLDLAQPLYEETLKLAMAKIGLVHPITLQSMNNLATTYQAAGKRDLALPLYEETLRLKKAKLGLEHPDTLQSMNNLASLYYAAGKLDLALPLYEETLRLQKAKLGPEHPDTLASMNNLAVGYRAAGKLDLALPLYEETLRLLKAKLGPEHPNTLQSMNNLAIAYQAAAKFDLALPLYEETLRLEKARIGPEHPNTLAIMGNLGKVYVEAKQGEKAAATLKDFIAGMRKRYPKDHPQFAGLQAQVAMDLLQCGQHSAAEEMLRECLAIREKTQPQEWSTFNTESMLGGSLLGQKKYAEAEPFLLEGYEGMKAREQTIPPQGGSRLPEALDRLVEFYAATGKPEQVKKWRAERAKYPAAPRDVAPPPREKK
jgi:serine/threonine protein kinase